MIFTLIGEEEKLAKTWLEEKLSNWMEEVWRPFNLHVLDGKKFSLEEFSTLVQSFPMGSRFRVIVLKNIGEIDLATRKQIPIVAQNALDSTHIIFWLLPASDFKKLSLPKNLEDFLQKGEIAKFNLKKNEKELWFQKVLKEKNLLFSREAELFLLEATGGNLELLENELEKIAEFGPIITKEDLELLSVQHEEKNFFELLDALGERDPKKALSILKSLLKQGEHPLRILSALAGQIRLFWQIKALQEERKSPSEMATLLGIHPFRITKAIGHVRRFKLAELAKFAEWSARADWSLKTGRQEPQYVLEILLARVCTPLRV